MLTPIACTYAGAAAPPVITGKDVDLSFGKGVGVKGTLVRAIVLTAVPSVDDLQKRCSTFNKLVAEQKTSDTLLSRLEASAPSVLTVTFYAFLPGNTGLTLEERTKSDATTTER